MIDPLRQHITLSSDSSSALSSPKEEFMSWLSSVVGKDISELDTLKESEKVDLADRCIKEKCDRIDIIIMLRYIQKFEIKDEGQRVSIAKSCAKKFPYDLVDQIKRFNISSQNELIAIARICQTKDSNSLEEHCDDFIVPEGALHLKNKRERQALFSLLVSSDVNVENSTKPVEVVERYITSKLSDGNRFKLRRKKFHDKILMKQLIITVADVVKSSLDKKTALRLIKKFADNKKSLVRLSAVIGMGEEKKLEDVVNNADLSKAMKTAFVENFGMKISPSKFDETFGQFREPCAPIILYGQLCTLFGEERAEALEELKMFVEEVVNNTFKENRYQDSPHLDSLGDINFWKKNYDSTAIIDGKTYPVLLTDDPCDLILSGDEVGDSCYSLDSQAFFNKDLLKIVLDGMHKIIEIKDPENGKILARAYLLLVKQGDKPALYFGTIHPKKSPIGFKTTLVKAAYQFSELHKIPLYSSNIIRDGPAVTLSSDKGRVRQNISVIQGVKTLRVVEGFYVEDARQVELK